MIRHRLILAFSLVLIMGLVLSACQSPQQVEVPVTVVVRETQPAVVQTQIVQQTVEVQSGAFTQPNPILSDIRVRQALAHCTNKMELIKSVYPLLREEEQQQLVMDTFIPKNHWAYAGDANITLYPFDAEKGKQLLDEAGWLLADDATFRTNAAGDELFLKFTTTTAAFRQTWAAVWQQQMENCGIGIVRQHVPASWWFGDTTGSTRRDFELGAWAWTGQADPGGQTLYACDQIPYPENGWLGQNYMGWCNQKASDGIKLANNTLLKDERIQAYTVVQQEFTKDMASLPLFNRTDVYAINATLQGFAPMPGQDFVTYNAAEWEIPGRDTIVYGFTQEPATLFTLVESAQVAVLANALIQGLSYTTLNYDYQPLTLKQFGTLENGGAQINAVEAREGDQVVDANGNIVELQPGVMIKNAKGEIEEFKGGAATMNQLVVTYAFRDDLVWSDGVPVSQADYELKFKIDCDRESGATTFITCDLIQKNEYFDNGYTSTFLPGSQSPIYFTSFDAAKLPDIYPAHRVIESEGPYQGKTLAEVPAKDWTTLPEIAENPIGVGPYVITEWVKGEKLVFDANPYYYGGAPKTPHIVISIITSENAEAQLIGGQVDILDLTTLVSVSEALDRAASEGIVQNFVIPSASWEHIDMNLFLP